MMIVGSRPICAGCGWTRSASFSSTPIYCHSSTPPITSPVVLQLAGFSSAAALTRAVELLDYLEVGNRRHAMPAQLSGGEGQRVAIARALANRPRIILADEPTAPLDSQRARIVMDLLRRIAVEQDAAIICVTHDEMILDRFDHIFRLRDGRLETEAPVGPRGHQVSDSIH